MSNTELPIAYKAGKEAKESGIKLKHSTLKNLLPGSWQYDNYIAGYYGYEPILKKDNK